MVKPPKFALVNRTYNNGIEKVREYYQTRSFVVKSQHILAQALTLGIPPLSYDIWRFLDLSYSRAEAVSRRLKMTSSLIYGKMFNNQFFSEDCQEFIISETHLFDVDLAVKNWKEIRPVRVIEHPFTDMSLNLLNGNKTVNNRGVCIVSVNIPLLYLQYRCYIESKEGNIDGVSGFHAYISRYALPNMLYSYADISIFNKLIRRQHAEQDDIVVKKPHFIFPTNESLLNTVLLEVLDKIKNSKLTYATMLANIPSIRFENAKDSLLLPDLAETRQVYWLLMRSRLRMMKGLIDIGGEVSYPKNTHYLSEIKIQLKRLLSQRVLQSLLPYDDYLEMNKIIEEIMAI